MNIENEIIDSVWRTEYDTVYDIMNYAVNRSVNYAVNDSVKRTVTESVHDLSWDSMRLTTNIAINTYEY